MVDTTLAQPTFELACDLMARPSVTPLDCGSQQMLADRLRKYGFAATWYNDGDVTNVWLYRHGRQGAPLLCYAGHTDVVPPGDVSKWKYPPFEPTVHAGCLYGRGAGDMKASIACAVVGIEAYLEQHPDTALNIALLLTSDEEVGSAHGSQYPVQQLAKKGVRIDYCVIAEPSSRANSGDRVRIGRRGSTTGWVTFKGRQGHAAYPEYVKNPIHTAMVAMTALQQADWGSANKSFPVSTFQWVNCHSDAGAVNVIPATMEAACNVRYSTDFTDETIWQYVRKILDSCDCEYDLAYQSSGRPFVSPDGLLRQSLRESIQSVMGFEPEFTTCGGTSDGRFLIDICDQLLELGPVVAYNHQVDERIHMEELSNLPNIHLALLKRLGKL